MIRKIDYTITNSEQFPEINLQEVEEDLFSRFKQEFLKEIVPELTLTKYSYLCKNTVDGTMAFEIFLPHAYKNNRRAILELFKNEVNEAIKKNNETVINIWIFSDGLTINCDQFDLSYGVKEDEWSHGNAVELQFKDHFSGSIKIDFSKICSAGVVYAPYDDGQKYRMWEFIDESNVRVQVTILN